MAVSKSIRPAIVRGSLLHFVGDVGFADLRTALCAVSAVRALQDERQDALKVMQASVGDQATFSAAAKREAELAAQIRRLRRSGGAL